MVSNLEKSLRIEKQVTKEHEALFEKKAKKEETNKKQTLEACKNTTSRQRCRSKKNNLLSPRRSKLLEQRTKTITINKTNTTMKLAVTKYWNVKEKKAIGMSRCNK